MTVKTIHHPKYLNTVQSSPRPWINGKYLFYFLGMQMISFNWNDVLYRMTRLHRTCSEFTSVNDSWHAMSQAFGFTCTEKNAFKNESQWVFGRIFTGRWHSVQCTLYVDPFSNQIEKFIQVSSDASIVHDWPRVIRFYVENVDNNSFYCRQIGRNGQR